MPYRLGLYNDVGAAHEAHLFDTPIYLIDQLCDAVTDALFALIFGAASGMNQTMYIRAVRR